jgi:predicted GIY-YIG superfamily endonuclease
VYEVYILKSLKDRRTYIGYAENAIKRLKEHNQGKVRATRYRCPLEIIYTERHQILSEAKKRELYWKGGAGRRKLKQYFEEGFPPNQS